MDEAKAPEKPRQRKHDTYWLLESAGNLFLWAMGGLFVRGTERVPKDGPVLLVSNHSSYLDPVCLGVVSPRRVVFMAKSELFDNKVLGYLLDGVDCFPVRRGEADRHAFKKTLDMLADNRVVCIFPEGTRSKDGSLGEAEPGAALFAIKTGCPVVPVYVEGTRTVLGPGTGLHRGRVTATFGEPFRIERSADREAAGRRLMDQIALVRDSLCVGPATPVPPHWFRKPVEGHRFRDLKK